MKVYLFPFLGYGVPSAAPIGSGSSPSSGYNAPIGAPLSGSSGSAPSSGYGSNSAPLAPPAPPPVPLMKAPRGPMPHSNSNNVIQEDSYGSPVNGNSPIGGKNIVKRELDNWAGKIIWCQIGQF